MDDETARAQVIRYEEVAGAADEQLAALEPPTELADDYAAFLDGRRAVNDARAELIAAPKAGEDASADAAYERIAALDAESYKLAAELGLEGCDNTLPTDEQQAVEETVMEIVSSHDGERVCEELVYPEFVDYAFGRGGLEECIQATGGPGKRYAVSIESVSGLDGGFATVDSVRVGGSDDGRRFRDRLFYDEQLGTWRLWDSMELG